ncbi:hypothetical protein SAMD00019534_106960 [Acytostelium subglobosum LB1]|uniref:hypothetical protein n=1 Tax=Acytostelium subglobosum LB1 TaxID=1410327 RepID=UPI0006451ACC|nr:hypothetical protein SAMD00019534_106960 [Acytostelium subglobosum LB1]GAM27520.1 hypothetical protein SAMD00019534_106960 [Acytostelium subglobosum LB1]|eukprot:XP_012749585.1 hypothetical protein SAMD00019534_106960 [Acytostelium subglobosum LB1]
MSINNECRAYLQKHISKTMRHFYANLHQNELDPQSREMKIGVLYLMMMYLGVEAMTPFIDAITEVMIVRVNDMVPTIQTMVAEICRIVGHVAKGSVLLPRLSERIKEELNTPSHKDTLLCQLQVLAHMTSTIGTVDETTLANLLRDLQQVVYSDQSNNRCLVEIVQVLSHLANKFPDQLQSSQCDKPMARLLILLNVSLPDKKQMIDDISAKLCDNCSNANLQQYIGGGGGSRVAMLLSDIAKRHTSHVLTHQSYFNTIDYIIRTQSLETVDIVILQQLSAIYSKAAEKDDSIQRVVDKLKTAIGVASTSSKVVS